MSIVTWAGFLACTLLILFAGTRVSRYADVISTKTGLGGTWIGVVLLATVTSLPEAITGFSGIVIFDVPKLAVGDIFGSCMFNLLIIASLDPTSRSAPLLSRASIGHILAASFGVILLGTAAAGILAADSVPTIGWISLVSVAIIVLYLFGMRTVFMYERGRAPDNGEVERVAQYRMTSLSRAYFMFAAYAVLIIVAAVALPGIGEDIADQTGLSKTIVGSLFIALSTSLPEVAVAVAAVRLGAIDLAIGGLLGSSLFNLAILAFDDLMYTSGSIFLAVDDVHAFAASTAIVMTGIAILGLMLRPRQRPPLIDWDALAMIIVYSGAMLIIFNIA